MSGLGRKLGKLRRNPRLFVYDLVAAQARGGGRPANWLLGKMTGVSTAMLIELAEEQPTINPLRQQLVKRIDQYGLDEITRAANAAIPSLWQDAVARAENLFIAMSLAILERDEDAATEFATAHVETVSQECIRSLILSFKGASAFTHALHFLPYLAVDDSYGRLESELYHGKLEITHGPALKDAIRGGREALEELAASLLEVEAPTPTYHFIYAYLLAAYARNKALAPLVTLFGERLLEHSERSWTAIQVTEAHLYLGNIGAALRTIERYSDHGDKVARNKCAQVRELARLQTTGFDYHPAAPKEPYACLPGQVMFVLHHSAPFHSNGYATRTHGLLTAINQRDWHVVGVTRLGYPRDLRPFATTDVEPSSTVDTVEYLRMLGSGKRDTPLHTYLEHYADALMQLALKKEPEVIHAHSNALNGLVANRVARALGIPSIYEVRGLWEVTRASRQPGFADSECFEMLHSMEIMAAKEADVVICITEGLAAEMARCGVDPDKIRIVPNGVDAGRFEPRPRDRDLEEQLGLAGKRVIGYVGSFVDYEGLDDLLAAVKRVVASRDDVAVLLVGDGVIKPSLEKLTRKLGLEDVVTFTGRVPHDQVERYYSLVDIAPFPRKSLPVTEMVSPLKPFEAMAMDKVIVASDVAAQAEVVEDGVNGLLFAKDDVGALAAALDRALDLADGESALRPRDWVIEHRSWNRIAERLDGIYQQLSSETFRPEVIDLTREALGDELEAIRVAYDERLAGDADHLLRRDDFARFGHVLGVLETSELSSLLDVGVGAGQFLNIVARNGSFDRLRGVDIERHDAFVALDGAFSVELASIEALPYQDGEFDAVTCLEVIEHLDPEIFEQGIAELRRVCRHQLVITVPFRERVLAEGHMRRFDLADLERLFPTARITIMRKGNSQLGRPTYWAMIEETPA